MSNSLIELYSIAAELRLIGDRLIEAGGELTPELETELRAWGGALEYRAANTGLLIQELQRSADVAEEEAERIHSLATVRRNAAERLKGYIQQAMETAGIKKIETNTIRLTICQNSQPKVEPYGEANPGSGAYPDFIREIPVKYEWDKKAILEAWKGGTLPEGVAEVIQNFHLRIK